MHLEIKVQTLERKRPNPPLYRAMITAHKYNRNEDFSVWEKSPTAESVNECIDDLKSVFEGKASKMKHVA